MNRNSKPVTITMPIEFIEKAKIYAKKRGMSFSMYIRFAVSELERKEK